MSGEDNSTAKIQLTLVTPASCGLIVWTSRCYASMNYEALYCMYWTALQRSVKNEGPDNATTRVAKDVGF